jgi:hypothetical protein
VFGEAAHYAKIVVIVTFWTIVVLLGLPALLLGVLFAWEQIGSFLSWRALDAETVQDRAEEYVLRYDIEDVAVCIYVVGCESGRARLEPVDVDEVDFDALRDRIWGRRFHDECPGRTANLGLHLVPLESAEDEIFPSQVNAYWTFGTDRFIPRWTRVNGGAFSEEPWQRCMPGHYAFVRRNGIISAPDRPATEGE